MYEADKPSQSCFMFAGIRADKVQDVRLRKLAPAISQVTGPLLQTKSVVT